jgi:hypothetical protein
MFKSMQKKRELAIIETKKEIEGFSKEELIQAYLNLYNIDLQKTGLIEMLESDLVETKDVLRQHVLILKDMATLFGVSEEDLTNDPFEVFGTEKIRCASCGKEVEKKRNICPECMYYVHTESL